jgi:hypothetical protein
MIVQHARWSCAGLLLALALATAPAAGSAAETEAEKLRGELEATKAELSKTRDQLESTQQTVGDLSRRLDAIEAQPSSAPPPMPMATARIAPVNADNPAISFAVDTAFASTTKSSYGSLGWPNGAEFTLKNAELFISAPIDPFLRGYVSINASSDEGFDVEEAALITTSLPANLTVKGGRFFAEFGRLAHWHDEALPFVDRPPSIDRLIGGESGAEGVEVSWLAPLDAFIQATGGVYNSVGEMDEEDFFGRRSFNELNYLGRLHTYADLTDDWNVELGATWLGVPQDHDRNLYGVDVTVRHQPGTQTAYQGLVWGTELLWNDQRFKERDDDGTVVDRRSLNRQGAYTYVEAFFVRRFSAGARFDYSESPEGAKDVARTASAFVTWMPSEFQRLRFQFDEVWGDQPDNQRFTLQWTAFIGSHSHGFAQR